LERSLFHVRGEILAWCEQQSAASASREACLAAGRKAVTDAYQQVLARTWTGTREERSRAVRLYFEGIRSAAVAAGTSALNAAREAQVVLQSNESLRQRRADKALALEDAPAELPAYVSELPSTSHASLRSTPHASLRSKPSASGASSSWEVPSGATLLVAKARATYKRLQPAAAVAEPSPEPPYTIARGQSAPRWHEVYRQCVDERLTEFGITFQEFSKLVSGLKHSRARQSQFAEDCIDWQNQCIREANRLTQERRSTGFRKLSYVLDWSRR
jgi:hypothetical protein